MSTKLRTLAVTALCGLLLAAPMAVAQVAQSPEIVMSDLDIDQYLPQVAYNTHHDEYLVVWQDFWPVQPRDVFGKRVDHYGNVIAEYVISSAVKDRVQPAVAYDPDQERYLVV